MISLLSSLAVLPVDAQQWPAWPQDPQCRKSVAKGTERLLKTVVKEESRCQEKRMLGKLPAATNCWDLSLFNRVAKAEEKMRATGARDCAAPGAGALQFQCPVPCGQIAVVGVDSAMGCFICLTEDGASKLTSETYGNSPPVFGSSTSSIKCQKQISRATAKYALTRVKEQERCQRFEDRDPVGMNCRIADPRGKVDKAFLKASRKIGKCDPAAFANLTTCGQDVDSVVNCTTGAADLVADNYFVTAFPPTDVVFVSPSLGSPTGDGSASFPVDTIQAGIALAVDGGVPNVFIDSDVYQESVTLASEVNLIGGFTSLTSGVWFRDGTGQTVVLGGTPAVLGNAVFDIVLDGLDIEAGSSALPGGSSYALKLDGTGYVLVRDSRLYGGPGTNGTAGFDGAPGADADTMSYGVTGDGGCEEGGNGGGICGTCSQPLGGSGGVNVLCPVSTGGQGGSGSHCELGQGADGAAGGGSGGGAGGATMPCDTFPTLGRDGDPGATGGPGTDGLGGAAFGSAGLFYIGAAGADGTAGGAGGGGGGGGGGSGGWADPFACFAYGGAGGGGGAGGCGGLRGHGGGGGGGSFGAWIWSGWAIIANSVISTDPGGRGGDGGFGGLGGYGSMGGSGGQGFQPSPGGESGGGGLGGTGGQGGMGGSGGGGGGGPSVGVVCVASGSVTGTGNFFNPGPGGTGGFSAAIAGADGLSLPAYGCP